MKRLRAGMIVALTALAVSLVQAWYYYPLLPDRVASHFGPDGRADGWMAKDAFIALNIGVVAFTVTLNAVLAKILARVPNELINLPNREYLLAPERRAESLAAMQDQLHGMNAATAALLVFVFQCVYQANLKPDPRLEGPFLPVLAIYFVYVAIWTIGLYRRFRLPGR